MRGEFIRDDGLVMPNNVTQAGAEQILRKAFRAESQGFFLGLGNAVFSPGLLASQVGEPAVGLGYARVPLAPGAGDWPTIGRVNGQSYIESKPVVFAVTGALVPVTRLFLADALTQGNILALGGPLPAALLLTPTTPVADRTFRYRLYLG